MTTQVQSTPLDTLKQTARVVENLLDILMDDFGGKYNIVDDDDEAFSITDSIRMELTKALAEHIPDLEWGPATVNHVYLSDAARQAVRTFDDGTPIWEQVKYGDVQIGDYFPRRDGPLDQHIQHMLGLIADSETRKLHEESSDNAAHSHEIQEPSGNWTGAETIDNIETAVQRLNAAAEPTNTDQHIEVMAGLAEWQFDAEALAAVGVSDARVARDLVMLLHAATHTLRGDVDPAIIMQTVGIVGGRLAHRIAGVDR